jgi:hypothetical protein
LILRAAAEEEKEGEKVKDGDVRREAGRGECKVLVGSCSGWG